MLKKIKELTVALAAVFMVGAPMLVPAVAHAALPNNDITTNLCKGLNSASGSQDSCQGDETSADSTLTNIIKTIINIFSLVVGFVSVVMIIVGGFKYITSGGESSNVTGAKNTIMYAIIGLIIVALAQVIVRFVLTRVTA